MMNIKYMLGMVRMMDFNPNTRNCTLLFRLRVIICKGRGALGKAIGLHAYR